MSTTDEPKGSLVLTVKYGQPIEIGEDINVILRKSTRGKDTVSLFISAPKSVRVQRGAKPEGVYEQPKKK